MEMNRSVSLLKVLFSIVFVLSTIEQGSSMKTNLRGELRRIITRSGDVKAVERLINKFGAGVADIIPIFILDCRNTDL
jgi:hypothetical protein